MVLNPWKRIRELEDEIDLLKSESLHLEDKNRDGTSWVRELMKGIKVDLSYLNGMKPEEVNELLRGAELLSQNKSLKVVRDHLISEQMDMTFKDAESWEQVMFGRATANGLRLLEEEILALTAMYQEKFKTPPEEFDPHSTLGSIPTTNATTH